MNSNTLRLLGFVVAILVLTLVILQSGKDKESPASGALLVPELKAVANDVDRLTITRYGQQPIAIEKQSGEWRVASRDGYPADTGDVRDVLLAMAEAKILEEKTADPDLFNRLGLQAPDVEGSKGILVTATAGERTYSVIFGNVVRGSSRYARIEDESQCWLIDRNPAIPGEAGEWLSPQIVDIDAAAVSEVTITHPDGEALRIYKDSAEQTDFDVADIPEGRELSYSTVANGIAGALNDLSLDDVRKAESETDPVITRFRTFDGMTVTVSTVKSKDQSWISVSAEADGDAAGKADEINARVAGWQYRIADYKANLLTRRWADILKAEGSADE